MHAWMKGMLIHEVCVGCIAFSNSSIISCKLQYYVVYIVKMQIWMIQVPCVLIHAGTQPVYVAFWRVVTVLLESHLCFRLQIRHKRLPIFTKSPYRAGNTIFVKGTAVSAIIARILVAIWALPITVSTTHSGLLPRSWHVEYFNVSRTYWSCVATM